MLEIVEKSEPDAFLVDMLRETCLHAKPGDRPTLVTFLEPTTDAEDDLPGWSLRGWDDLVYAKLWVRLDWRKRFPGEPCPVDNLPPPSEGHFYHIMTVFGRALEVEVYPIPDGILSAEAPRA